MKKPLVLHICCAPDQAWGITMLKEQYDITCFFCNPNIAPVEEYSLRLDEAKKVAKHYNLPIVADNYDPQSWENAVLPHVSTPEGGERCRACFLLRLGRTALFCKDVNISQFATVMSVSPHKNIRMLKETGDQSALLHSVNFLETDLKKNDGFKKSAILSESLGLYRQDYCGCRLSKTERDIRVAKRSALPAGKAPRIT